VVDFDGLGCIRHLDEDDLGGARLDDLGPLECANVSKELDDVVLADALLQVGDQHFGALEGTHGCRLRVQAIGHRAGGVGRRLLFHLEKHFEMS
jgi:hypothetical protein